jgi:hypothetical protein
MRSASPDEPSQLIVNGTGTLIRFLFERLYSLTARKQSGDSATVVARSQPLCFQKQARDSGMYRQSGHLHRPGSVRAEAVQ